jgi:Fe-only nitrogenase accessory protein AnfO
MAKEIGTFVNEDGMTTLLNNPCQLIIYSKQQGSWRVVRKMSLNLGEVGGLTALRIMMGDIIGFLAECNIVIAEGFQGVALHELEKAGVGLWEVIGQPEPLLEHILSEEEKSATVQIQAEKTPFPALENRGNGQIFISIADVQRSGGGVTSKQVLLPILQNASFRELEILCVHVPPWLEAEAASKGWTSVVKRNENKEVCVTIKIE